MVGMDGRSLTPPQFDSPDAAPQPVQPDETADDPLRRVIAQVIERRGRGELLSDADVIAANADLMPTLAQELEALRMLRRAMLAARKAGPIQRPIVPIDADDLESPIDPDEGASREFPDELPPAGEGVLSEGLSFTDEWHSQDVDRPQLPPTPPIFQARAFMPGLRKQIPSLPRAPLPGYQIISEISRGGQAAVYKAVQESTGRKVAVKILPGGALASAQSRARFDREAAILARLEHPDIVSIIDRGCTADGSLFLVMPYIDGCSLEEFAGESQMADADFPDRVLRSFVKIAWAVHEAHAQGIVHRDLKPSNIRVDARGEPHLLDFGLARLLEPDDDDDAPAQGRTPLHTLTVAGQVVGSLPWASPEQATGRVGEIDRRSDVYSLGVCLYQCLTGQFPYPVTGSIAQTIDHITSTPPGRLRDTGVVWTTGHRERAGTGRLAEIDAVLNRALAKLPAERYATAADFARDLEAIVAGRPVSAGASPASEPVVRGRLLRRFALIAAAILTLTGAAVAYQFLH
jgi:serine/threonine protein kinase